MIYTLEELMERPAVLPSRELLDFAAQNYKEMAAQLNEKGHYLMLLVVRARERERCQ